jgi:hypothetical protein
MLAVAASSSRFSMLVFIVQTQVAQLLHPRTFLEVCCLTTLPVQGPYSVGGRMVVVYCYVLPGYPAYSEVRCWATAP